MPTSNKSFDAFSRPQQPLAFVGVNRVLDVLLVRYKLQVFEPVIRAIKIFVVDLKPSKNRPVERFPHNSMNSAPSVLAVFAQRYLPVAFQQSRFARPVRCVSNPNFSKFYVAGRCQASVQKFRNFSQQRALLKHALGFSYFCAIQSLTARNTAYVARIADFVQAFKTNNRFPHLHAKPPFNVNRSIA